MYAANTIASQQFAYNFLNDFFNEQIVSNLIRYNLLFFNFFFVLFWY